MEELDTSLITRSLNYHGQQLTKLWECEQGLTHLAKLKVNNLDYQTYSQRQKGLIFQERVKRLQLHEFIAKNAQRLFHKDVMEKEEIQPCEDKSKKYPLLKYAQLPPYELFLDVEKSKRVNHFLQYLQKGSIIVGTITGKTVNNYHIKVLYLEGETVYPVPDLNIKALGYVKHMQYAVVNKNSTRPYIVADNIRCEVMEIVPETERLVVGTLGTCCPPDQVSRLGYLLESESHVALRIFMEFNKKDSYPEVLDKSAGFYNPKNVDNLSNELQLGSDKTPSHFMELKGQVPEGEMAPELRAQQANKWSMKSVADGIAFFKAGKFTEAFQCLNKALSIDPNNVEGLTARGALFANNGNFAKAIGDFESALKLNPAHGNARKYLGETLVARGRSLEEELKYNEAIGSYEACLRIVPYHEEATNSIKYLKERLEHEETDLTSSLPPLNISSKVNDVKATLKQLLAEEKEKEGKKKKEKKKRKRHSSSSSSSSSSDDISSDSSVSSSSSDTSQDSSSKKKKKKKKNKERSLSPLSKRMAGSVQGNGLANRTYNPSSATSNLMGIFDSVTQPPPVKSTETEYDLRVTQFLEQTKGDNDYEEKVRKFLEETAKWKKEQRLKDKKKRKKEKKSKDKLKKKKKEEKRKRKLEEKKLKEQANEFRTKTGLAALGVSDLQSFQSKLSEFYSRMNKPPSPSPVKKKETVESSSKVSKKARRSSSSSSSESEVGGKSPPPRKSTSGAAKRGPASGSKQRAESPPPKSARVARSRSSSPERKKVDIFADSPPPQSKNENSSSTKFKMQINSNKIKKDSKDNWSHEEEEDNDVEERHYAGSDKKAAPLPPTVERHKVVNVGVDKLSGFRINLDAQVKKPKPVRDSTGRGGDSDDSDDSQTREDDEQRRGVKKPRKSRSGKRRESRSSSRSDRSNKRHSSSRSSSSSSYENGKRYRRKQRYSSDSRSRSRSYSHSRSRSYSPYSRRGGGGHRGMRGTYYKPRPYYQHPRGGGGPYVPRGRGRGRGYDYRGGNRGGYVPRGRGGYAPGGNYNGGHSRPRYFHYKGSGGRDPRETYYGSTAGGSGRYEKRPRSPGDEEGSPMRKVHAEKARIDRMIDKHPSGPLSEGEERDDEDGELR